ncbi:type IV pilin N-terminal domain-containing protein [Halorubraceae archaeon YAN]|nr:type IV pilin N-terminal domain-containing protein [Halorubraceae archaeon YAN]
MHIKQFITSQRAVSPVIGVILMVAITVILAAVVGTFVIGLGDSIGTAPTANFNFDYTNATGNDTLVITHSGGDTIDGSQLSIVASGVELSPSDTTWSGGYDGAARVSAGQSITVEEGNLSDATIRLIWTDASGDRSATLATWSGPNA